MRSMCLSALALTTLIAAPPQVSAELKLDQGTFSSVRFRSIGPALMSGRIGDIAIHPDNPAQWWIAACSGGVWRTDNAGATFTPVFDGEGSYSIGCLAIDPNNPNVIWVGTGENNSQRSVSFGDGVYKSVNGGKSWTHVGLPNSEHIGMIAIDPRDSDVVYVASQGPLWRDGGDRGLYKTTDGGKTWKKSLYISEKTGVNEVHLDPRDPDTLYASTYQRRRHVWTLINGGPESAIYKSTDAGETWRKVTRGLPGADKGRIGMDISPVNPDMIYAIVEAAEGSGGVFRSTDRGETWEKRSSYMSSSPQYYNELVCDPRDPDKVYSLNTWLQVTEDGGATWNRVPIRNKHVDDHALWIDPHHPDHMINGNDGGLYETWDGGQNWKFFANLPITQFYRVAVDNSEPFYYVYGGTQDNNTQGGPSRTTDSAGITNADWFITVGGDGFETVVDPEDPNIVYSQWQYGGLVRFDRRTGESADIKPREAPGEEPYVFHWDSPLRISPHSHTRLYFAGDRLFKSENRGDSWEVISPDMTRGIDRNQLEVMGEIQKPDAVSKNRSTSIFGNIVSLTESTLTEGLIYVGTDDGLVHVTRDGGENWRRISVFPKVPDMTYVSFLMASRHEEGRVYAAFDNHKMGDFAPYLLRSDDFGENWEPVMGDLPERDIVYCVQEDHVDPDLLFVGTEFGAYYTRNGGDNWIKLSGLPTIAVRDMEIQRRENDVVVATFGRGFYVLDDYTPIRHVTEEMLEEDAAIFPIKDALLYVERSRLGGGPGGKAFSGASLYTAPNPEYGAAITFHLKETLKTRKAKRKEAEKRPDWEYPTVDEFRAEDDEVPPRVYLEISDESGDVIRRVDAPAREGVHRVTWDLRFATYAPISAGGSSFPGPLVTPGTYQVAVFKDVDGEITQLGESESFEVVALDRGVVTDSNPEGTLAFRKRVGELYNAVQGTNRIAGEIAERIDIVRRAIRETPDADQSLAADAQELRQRMLDLRRTLTGDRTLSRLQEPQSPSISSRVSGVLFDQWNVTTGPTQTQRDQYEYASEALEEAQAELRDIIEGLESIEEALDDAGAPWTPGRFPNWNHR